MSSKTLKASIIVGGGVSSSFRNALTSTQSGFNGIGDAISRVERRQRLLGKSINTFGRMGKDVGHMRMEYAGLAHEADRLRVAQSRLARVQSRIDANMDRRSALQGRMFGAVAAAVAFAAPVTAAVKFESTMADVKKVVNFDTPAQFRQMGKDVLKLSTQLPMAADGIGSIVAAAGQAGIARKELVGFARDAVKMGVAFDLTADQAGGMMATWRTAFDMSQRQVRTLADQVNYLGNTGKATAAQISTIVTKVGPLGLTAGLSAAEVGALGSAMVSMGAQQDVAGTAIKRMALNLTQGAAATSRQKNALGMLGMTSTQVAKDMQRDATGTILHVLSAVKQLPKAQQSSVMSQLFGSESLQAIAPLLNQLDLLRERFRAVGDATLYTGSMSKEYASRAATTANNLQLLKNRAMAAGVTMGSVLLPAVNSVAGVLGKTFNSVASLAEEYPTLTKVVVGGTAALVGLTLAATAGGYAFTFLKGGVLRMIGIFRRETVAAEVATVATRGFGIAAKLAFGLIGLVIGAAAFLVIKHWGAVKSFLGGVWAGVKAGIKPVMGVLSDLWITVKQAFAPLGILFNSANDNLDKCATTGEKVGQVIGVVLGTIVTAASYVVRAFVLVGQAIGTAAGWTVVHFTKAWDRVKQIVGAAVKWIMDKLSPVINVGKTIGNAMHEAKVTLGLAEDDGTASPKRPLALPKPPPRRTWKWNTGSADAVQDPARGAVRDRVDGTTVHQNVTINVTPNPGESEEGLARRVVSHMKRMNAVDRRGSLMDAPT